MDLIKKNRDTHKGWFKEENNNNNQNTREAKSMAINPNGTRKKKSEEENSKIQLNQNNIIDNYNWINN